MRIGILGGTFDPFHAAHGYMAEETLRLLDLDKLIIMPNGDPPHKNNYVTLAEHRFNMVNLAVKGIDGIEVSDFEIKTEKPSYTWKTVKTLKENYYPNDDLFFIMGRDSLISFFKWREPETILKYTSIVCFDRPGYREEEVIKSKEEIEKLGGKIILFDSLDLEISSTEIRNRFKNGNVIKSFLHKDVLKYIEKNGLYRK